MWLDDIGRESNPGPGALGAFVHGVFGFLGQAIEDPELGRFLWENDGNLQSDAKQTFYEDVAPAAKDLEARVQGLPDDAVTAHGLRGTALRFKLRVVASIARRWENIKGTLGVREWFRKMCEAIDALLDSLIEAAGGAGGLIKEFKDSLMALA